MKLINAGRIPSGVECKNQRLFGNLVEFLGFIEPAGSRPSRGATAAIFSRPPGPVLPFQFCVFSVSVSVTKRFVAVCAAPLITRMALAWVPFGGSQSELPRSNDARFR